MDELGLVRHPGPGQPCRTPIDDARGSDLGWQRLTGTLPVSWGRCQRMVRAVSHRRAGPDAVPQFRTPWEWEGKKAGDRAALALDPAGGGRPDRRRARPP